MNFLFSLGVGHAIAVARVVAFVGVLGVAGATVVARVVSGLVVGRLVVDGGLAQ